MTKQWVEYDARREAATTPDGTVVFRGAREAFERWAMVERAQASAVPVGGLPAGRARFVER